MSNAFADIPDYDPLPVGPNGEGYGVSDEDHPTIKAADIVDTPIAVVGFLAMENRFKEKESDPDEVVLYEVMDSTGERSVFWHTSKVLNRQVRGRWERDQIPFKTTLTRVPSPKKGRQPYYSFA